MNENQLDKIKLITQNYTFGQQRNICIEECAELIQAICKTNRDGIDADEYMKRLDNMAGEVADVIIMANQMRIYLGEAVDKAVDEKLNRQIKRIMKEKEQLC